MTAVDAISAPPTTEQTSSTTNINLIIEFTGGLELLFDNISKHSVSLSSKNAQGKPTTVGDLVSWLVDNLLKDPRKELFVLDGGVRPGILVLINDADWELEGEDKYELKDKDNVLFVSTLHGG